MRGLWMMLDDDGDDADAGDVLQCNVCLGPLGFESKIMKNN